MKKTEITISMIVLLYKGKHYLKRILEMYHENCIHFREQFPGLETEMIFVNDCPDEKIDLLQVSLESYNIKIVQNERNMGIHRSKIEGLKTARGEFVFFLDQDDLISSFYFVEQYKLIGICDAVVCNADRGDGPLYSGAHEEALDLNYYLQGGNAISSLGQVLIKKVCIPKEWECDPLCMNGADDYFLIFLMILKKQPIVEHRKVLYYHVYTGGNFSTDFKAICISVIEVLERMKRAGLITQKTCYLAAKSRQNQLEEFEKIKEKYPGDVWQERLDNIKLINLYDRCLKNLEADYKMDSYIKTYRCNSIAVYGAGKMGKHFIYWMRHADVKIVVLIDRAKRGEINGIPIVDLREAKEYSENFDMIVVTPMVETDNIIIHLEKSFACPVISLETVVYNMPCQSLKRAHEVETDRYIVNQ